MDAMNKIDTINTHKAVDIENTIDIITRPMQQRIIRTPDETKSAGGLRGLWEWWKRVAKRIGDIQARVILILFYFVVLGPFALVVRWGSDPLAIKAGTPRGWRSRGDQQGASVERAARQF
jgi:hypothetical protein